MADSEIDWKFQYANLENQMQIMLLAIAKRMDVLAEAAKQPPGKINRVEHEYVDGKILCVAVACVDDAEYAWYVHRPDGDVETIPWSRRNELVYETRGEGNYRVDAHVRRANDETTLLIKSLSAIVVSSGRRVE